MRGLGCFGAELRSDGFGIEPDGARIGFHEADGIGQRRQVGMIVDVDRLQVTHRHARVASDVDKRNPGGFARGRQDGAGPLGAGFDRFHESLILFLGDALLPTRALSPTAMPPGHGAVNPGLR